MPGYVFGKRRSGEGAWLVRNPLGSVDCDRSFSRTAPSLHLLTVKQKRDCSRWSHRVEMTLCIPACDAAVEDCVGQREEHLGVLIDVVVIAGGNKLREQIPVPRRQLRVRTVGPILSDHLL